LRKKYLLVDGYNIINAWRDVFDPNDDLEMNRDKLTDMLVDFWGNKDFIVIVVFDAQQVKGGKGSMLEKDGIFIVFTEENETADNYIEKFVYEKGSVDRIFVATSDYMEQRLVITNGGARITPKELKKLLEDNKKAQRRIINSLKDTPNTFLDFLTPEQKKWMERLRRKGHG
jgi:predicted RNA-binding protein with PIN domain